MVQRLHEERPLPGEERVDRVQPGLVRRWQDSRIEPVGAREPAELEEAEVERDERDPERRHRNAAERDDTKDMVGGTVSTHGGDHSERDPEESRDDDRIQRELGRGRDELAEIVRHGVVRQRGLPEIALDEMLQVEPVPDGQRLVEAVMRLEGCNGSGIGRRLLSEVGGHRVARHELGEHEDDERDADGEQNERSHAPKHEAQEARGRTGSTPGPRRVDHGGGRRRQGPTIVQRRTRLTGFRCCVRLHR